MDHLEEMMQLQYELQRRANGYNIEDQSMRQQIENIKINVLAGSKEMHEILDEMAWKPWVVGAQFINLNAARKEAIDFWHFAMNIFLHLGMTSQMVYDMYVEKNTENHRRFDVGWDLAKGVCPQCGRDLTQVDLREIISDIPIPNVILYCPCGREVGRRAV